MSNTKVAIKRIYQDSTKKEEFRVLIDRIWPRGVSREDAKLDEWIKDIAPSTELRKWFIHDSDRFEEFKKHYKNELVDREDLLNELVDKLAETNITLLYSAKNELGQSGNSAKGSNRK